MQTLVKDERHHGKTQSEKRVAFPLPHIKPTDLQQNSESVLLSHAIILNLQRWYEAAEMTFNALSKNAL